MAELKRYTVGAERETDAVRIAWRKYRPNIQIPRHRHSRTDLTIALSGGYEERLESRSRRVDVGTILSHPAGEAHANRHDPVSTTLLTIELSPACLDAACSISNAFRECWQASAPLALPAAYQIAHCLQDRSTIGELAIDEAFWVLIGTLFPKMSGETEPPPWLRRIRDRLDAEYACAPSLSAMADEAGIHPMHLTRSFKRAYGGSIGQLLRRRRLAEALRLLGPGQMSLAEISAAVGYADQSHMTRQMRALTGMSPGGWRRQLI